MTAKYITIHEGENIKMLSPKAWYKETAYRVDNDLCVECGAGLYLREHVTDLDRRKTLEPMFENDYNGLCWSCHCDWWRVAAQDAETQAAL
jgi:hypothetical protein